MRHDSARGTQDNETGSDLSSSANGSSGLTLVDMIGETGKVPDNSQGTVLRIGCGRTRHNNHQRRRVFPGAAGSMRPSSNIDRSLSDALERPVRKPRLRGNSSQLQNQPNRVPLSTHGVDCVAAELRKPALTPGALEGAWHSG